jgi:hypothetical protein
MAAPKPIDTKDDAIVGAFMIVPKPQPAPGPQEPPAPEPKYTWYNGLVLLGYTYGFEQPLGFSFGIFGLYFSYGWALLDWGDYYKLDDHVAGKPPTGDRYGDRYSIDYYSSPILDQKYESTDFVMGYTVTIIPQILYSPIGVGLEFVKEWRLQRPINSDGIESSADPSWNPDRKDTVSFLLEAGLLLRLKRTIGPYLFVTYRNIGISKHSFAIGGGGSWAFF